MEINGLKVIVSESVERGTIHVLQSPPAREDFASDDEYSAAYHKWWTTMHCWSATIKNIDS